MILAPVIEGIQRLTGVLNNIDVKAAISKFKELASTTASESSLISGLVNNLKSTLQAVVRALFDVVVPFFRDRLKEITKFWSDNGSQILQAVTVAFNGVKAVFDFVLPAILFVVRYIWDGISNVITGAIRIINGVIKTFSSVLTGDWSGLWEGIKMIVSGVVTGILGVLSLTFVGGIRTLFVNLGKNILNLVRTNWNAILGVVRSFSGNITGAVRGLVSGVINFFKSLATQGINNFNTLRTFGANIFNALREVVVNSARALVTGYINYLRNLGTNAVNILRTASTGIINAVKNLPSQFVTIGKQMIQGLINGIKSLNPIAAVSGIAKGMVDRVKSIFDINSPSRVFTQIGEFVSQGLAIGVDNFAELPVETIVKMADRVVQEGKKAAQTAVSVINSVKTAAQRETRAVTNDLNKQLDAISKKAATDAQKVQSDANARIRKLQQAEDNRKKKDASKLAADIAKINSDAEKRIDTIQAKATADRSKARTKANADIAKIESQINSDRLKALNEYAEAQKQANNFSIAEEIEYWKRAVKSFQDGSKEQTEARKKYNAAIQQYNQQLISNTQNYINEQRDLNNITVLDEVDLWQSVVNQLDVGSKEYLTARKNYQVALKTVNDQIVSINQDFSNRIKSINDDLIKNENDLNKAYDDAYNKRFSALNNFSGLFDEFGINVETTGEELLSNLQSQVTGLNLYQQNIDDLARRGIGGALLDELSELGPKALPQLIALNQLTDQQLAQYQATYEERARVARERTESELTELRLNTQSQIQQLRNNAIIELGKLETEWQNQILAISQVTQDGLSNTRQIGIDAATNLLDGLTSLEPTLVTRARAIAESVSNALNTALNGNTELTGGITTTPTTVNTLRGTALNLGEIGGIVDRVTSGSGAVNTNNSKTQVNNVTVYTNEADIEIERVNRRLSFGF